MRIVNIKPFAMIFFIVSLSFGVFAEDEGIEEVVVTGSYIKRSTADSPSPLSIINREEMDAIGAVEIKDVVANMTYQSGNISSSNVYSGGDSSSGNTTVDIRA